MEVPRWLALLLVLCYAWILRTLAIHLARRYKQFSLQQLLIGMTLASVLLGALAIWLRS